MGGCLVAAGIYAIVNVMNGMRYVGQASDIERRWAEHRSALRNGTHVNQHLQAAFMKYGEGAFEFCVVDEVFVVGRNEASRLALILAEQFYIDLLGRWTGTLYNISPTAGSLLGVKHTAVARAKMSAAKRGKPKSAEHRAKMSAAKRGKSLSAETRAKISAASLGKSHTTETRAKISAANLGKSLSAETRAKMSAKLSGENNPWYGKSHTAETRAKISAANRGKSHTAVARAKISAAVRANTHVARHTRWHIKAGKPCNCAPEVIAAYQQSHKLHAR
jgi:group I intron endonuclease